MGSDPSHDDDPTGVRALLSSLPEPDPMPAHLVERINASLAAEQARRAAATSVTPLLTRAHRRPSWLALAIAGAAAAIVLVAVVGNTMFQLHQRAAIRSSTALASTSSGSAASGPSQSPAAANAPSAARAGAAPVLVQIGQSEVRYTRADFVTQVQTLRRAPFEPITAASASIGPTGTVAGLRRCLSAIGAAQAQMVRVDVAFYQGQPAVIIVTTTNDVSVAYAVGRQCSQTDAWELRPATPLP
jgi:hypothetical protein